TSKTASSLERIQIECWTHNEDKRRGERYNWRCRVSVPGGRIQVATNESQFLAPLENYVASDEIEMAMDKAQHWQDDVTRNYFLQFANSTFARLKFRMVAGGDH